MRLSINWLCKYVEITETPHELADMLTMLGFEAEVVKDFSKLNHIVSANVESVEKHPNADKLTVCKVNDGSNILQVVCGAPNVEAGQKVIFAKIRAKLPNNLKIEKVKIRGEVSCGMLCAEDELGISGKHDGIIILPDDTKIGVPIAELFKGKYDSIELEITPNRPDALSHYGIAREIALKTNRKLIYPAPSEVKPKNKEQIKIKISDTDGCPRYIAGIVDNIKVSESPDWLKEFLHAAGQRSINHVVDISNFVLLELGHPTHIFDVAQIPSNTIGVRRAKSGETFTTLDEEKRKLDEHHLLITDGEKPIALAGIMGGLGSAVSENTKKVLVESAYFDPITIRKGSKSLGMLTESSRRFERGADPNGAVTAFWRIVELLQEYAGGELVSEMIDEYPKKVKFPKIVLRHEEINAVAGVKIDQNIIEKILGGLGINWKLLNAGNWECQIPSFRPDLLAEIDLIEEIIRVFGYDNIRISKRYGSLFNYENHDPKNNISTIINALVGLGFRQCFNNSLLAVDEANLSGNVPVKTINPLSEKLSGLRTSLLPGLLKNIDYNIKNGATNLLLFEIGQINLQKRSGFEGIVEKSQLAGVVHGLQSETSLHNEQNIKQSFYFLKGYINNIFQTLLNTLPNYKEVSEPEFSTCYSISVHNEKVGYMGIVNNGLVNGLNLDISGKIYVFKFDIDKILILLDKPKYYQQISKFPTIERDLNFVMDENIKVGEIVGRIKEANFSQLKSVIPKNIFRHTDLGSNQKSVVYNLIFQDKNKTLEDDTVNSIINIIINDIESNFNAKLRQ